MSDTPTTALESGAGSAVKTWPALLVVVAGSLLFSVLALWLDVIINYDAVRYLRMAEYLAAGDTGAALALYKWPLYPWLIALLSNAAGMDVHTAAVSLNTLFICLMGAGFVTLVRVVGGGRAELWAAVLLFLAWAPLNELRAEIVRDFGFFAALLWAMVFLLRASGSLNRRDAGLAVGLLIIAGLFRIEGMALALAVPVVLAGAGGNTKRLWLGLAALVAVSALLAVLWRLGDLGFDAVGSGALFSEPAKAIAFLEQGIPHADLGEHAVVFYLAGSAASVFMVVLESGWLWLFFAAIGWRWARPFSAPQQRAWLAFIGLYLALWLAYVWAIAVIAERHAFGPLFLLGLVAPFGMVWAWRQGRPVLRGVVVLALLISVVDGFTHSGPAKTDLLAAANWLREHNPTQQALLSNSERLIYLSGSNSFRPYDKQDWSAVMKDLKNDRQSYRWVAFRYNHRETGRMQMVENLLGSPIARFENSRGDQTLIYRIN